MPKPIRIMRREIKERLKGKAGQQKMDEIENLLEEIPWDVGDYRILKSELKNELDQMRHLKSVIKSSRAKYQLKKESPQMIIAGATKAGKSYLLNQLTNAGAKN